MNNIYLYINGELKLELMNNAYGMVWRFFGETKVQIISIKSANDIILYEEIEEVKCLKEYLEQL